MASWGPHPVSGEWQLQAAVEVEAQQGCVVAAPPRPEDRLGFLRIVRVEALWRLGRLGDARQAAQEAVAVEPSEKTRRTLRDVLAD